MALSKLSPTAVVLSIVALFRLMASLNPPVLSMETGYDYNTDEYPTSVDRYKDLKCTYLFAAVTHLRLLKLILEDRKILTRVVVGLVTYYEVRGAICTLYKVKDVEVGSLWLLLLYANTVHSYQEHNIVRSANEADQRAAVDDLEVIHDYVMERMHKELTTDGCRPGNRFDSFDNWLKANSSATSPNPKPSLRKIKTETLGNCDKLKSILMKNNAHFSYGMQITALLSRNMFLNNLGINKYLKSELMNKSKYDVQVIWSGTSKMLRDDYHYAQKMYSPADGLLSVKKYYNSVFNFFKCILYRMTWNFMLYVHASTGSFRKDNFEMWHDLLLEFQNLLCLQDDPDVNGLLVVMHNHGSVEISNQLDAKLRSFNVCLQCVS